MPRRRPPDRDRSDIPTEAVLRAYVRDGTTAADLMVCFGLTHRTAARIVREAAKKPRPKPKSR